jgi:hypothetical protein
MRMDSFSQEVIAAFPFNYRRVAERTADALRPFVDTNYRQTSVEVQVLGRSVCIPRRIHFTSRALPASYRKQRRLVIQCIRSRSTDGYLRQEALRAIVDTREPAAIPFIVLLAGEYVVEIIDDIVRALPTLDRAAYANFVRENRHLMQGLRTRATSYWDCYYRGRFPERGKYPGLLFLHEIERWAV